MAILAAGPAGQKGLYTSCSHRHQHGRRLAASPLPAARLRPCRLAVRASSDEPGSLMRPRIKIPPSSKKKITPPKPADIIHSSTYTLSEDLGSDDFTTIDIAKKPKEAVKSNADGKGKETPLQVVLERADKSMASIEENPPAVAKAFWDVVNGPVGNTAGKGLKAAINTSVKVGKEAATAAAPAGKWAAKQGAKLLFSAVAKGVQGEGAKKKKDNQSGKE